MKTWPGLNPVGDCAETKALGDGGRVDGEGIRGKAVGEGGRVCITPLETGAGLAKWKTGCDEFDEAGDDVCDETVIVGAGAVEVRT